MIGCFAGFVCGYVERGIVGERSCRAAGDAQDGEEEVGEIHCDDW